MAAGRASLSVRRRDAELGALASEQFDLAVIGGGITGAGIARDAARRGLAVALLEARDFACGTSSRSTKLIHGGLRYLAQAEINVVRKTALERKEIHRLAPHLAEPRWMLLPARSLAMHWILRTGVALYEHLGAVDAADRHQIWSLDRLAREEPLLDRARFPRVCAYREYLTDDARLVIANLRAAAAHGARCLNHVPVTGFQIEGGRARGVRARCALSGRELDVRARAIVNATGPWVEEVRSLEAPGKPSWLHLSKGIHVGLPRERLPLQNPLMLQAADRRPLFAIPRGRIVFVGTTDTTHAAGPEVWPRVERAEVEYLLATVQRYFGARFGPADVVTAWAGLRPLIAEPGKAPHEISRRDEIAIGPTGVVSIAGGKLTGYRPMAWAVLERVGEVLGRALPPPPPETPLPGGERLADASALAQVLDVSGEEADALARRLASLYGSEASAVVARGPALLPGGAHVLEGEVDWAVDVEGAASVEDVVYRRARLAPYDPQAGAAAEPVARRMAQLLGWDERRAIAQAGAVRERLARDLDFDGAPASAPHAATVATEPA
jgi:glycerol-3-phosphate dehydrogenase